MIVVEVVVACRHDVAKKMMNYGRLWFMVDNDGFVDERVVPAEEHVEIVLIVWVTSTASHCSSTPQSEVALMVLVNLFSVVHSTP